MIYLLDASALIRYLTRSPSLSPLAKDIIDAPGAGNQLAIPTIALVEAWDVARKQRRDFVPFSLIRDSIQSRNMIVEDLTLAIVDRLPNEWEDSHDMIILATALELQTRYGEITVISSDRKMRFDQSLVPCLW